MIERAEAVRRGVEAGAMLYDVARKDDTQLGYLYDLAVLAPDGPAVECGVYAGGSLVCWAAAREGRGEVIAVDDWSSKTRDMFFRSLQRYALSCRVLEMPSWQAPALLAEPVAFCFIDANHGEPFARDLAAWPAKMAPGGILAFHDYGVWKPTVMVKRYVDEWRAGEGAAWEQLGQVGAVIAFRRPAC